ncbi:MAG: FKBP-type peptidyl-prolyl cis-trans isomerase [Flavitalea sp.]
MKNITLSIVFLSVAFASFAQATKPKTTVKKISPAVKTPTLKSALDSFSYAVGLSMAGFYKEQGVHNINNALVVKALNDVKNGKPLLDDSQTNNVIVSFMTNMKSEKAVGAKKEGQAFLDSNKNKPGVVSLPSGLQYTVVKEGSGAKPQLTDKVKVHYEGSLINGKIFDSSIQRGEPIELNVNGVIPGWTEALQLMTVGSKWKLFIPSDLGYGDNGAGADIKPGATLIFDVELLDIVK